MPLAQVSAITHIYFYFGTRTRASTWWRHRCVINQTTRQKKKSQIIRRQLDTMAFLESISSFWRFGENLKKKSFWWIPLKRAATVTLGRRTGDTCNPIGVEFHYAEQETKEWRNEDFVSSLVVAMDWILGCALALLFWAEKGKNLLWGRRCIRDGAGCAIPTAHG